MVNTLLRLKEKIIIIKERIHEKFNYLPLSYIKQNWKTRFFNHVSHYVFASFWNFEIMNQIQNIRGPTKMSISFLWKIKSGCEVARINYWRLIYVLGTNAIMGNCSVPFFSSLCVNFQLVNKIFVLNFFYNHYI